MAKTSIQDHRAYAASILARLKGSTPAALRPAASDLRAAHGAFEQRAALTDKARALRDAALEGVGDADDALDASLGALAAALVGAGAPRQRPFAAFGKLTPSAVASLGYAEEAKVVAALAKAILAAKPAPAVKKAALASGKLAGAVAAALAALTRPQAAYSRAQGERDAALPALDRAIRRLKRLAAAAFDEDRAAYDALFAPVLALQAPKKRRSKRAAPAVASEPAAG